LVVLGRVDGHCRSFGADHPNLDCAVEEVKRQFRVNFFSGRKNLDGDHGRTQEILFIAPLIGPCNAHLRLDPPVGEAVARMVRPDASLVEAGKEQEQDLLDNP
jgi:hypothetical protein